MIDQFLCFPESALFNTDEFQGALADSNAENVTEAPAASITGDIN